MVHPAALYLQVLSRFLFFGQSTRPGSTLFPYTTLFRSVQEGRREGEVELAEAASGATMIYKPRPKPPPLRSEEHTSELQSRENLVCRLLLEKKKSYDNEKCQSPDRVRPCSGAEVSEPLW